MPLVLARLFSITDFGSYKQVFLIYGTVLALGQVGMAESLYYFIPSNVNSSGRHTSNALATLGAAGLISFLLLWLGRHSLASLFNNPALATYLPVVGAALAFGLAAIPLEIVMISRKHYAMASRTYAISEIVRVGAYLVPVAFLGGAGSAAMGSHGLCRVEVLGDLGIHPPGIPSGAASRFPGVSGTDLLRAPSSPWGHH